MLYQTARSAWAGENSEREIIEALLKGKNEKAVNQSRGQMAVAVGMNDAEEADKRIRYGRWTFPGR